MNYWKIFKETGIEFFNDDPMSYSASIAFYTIFSLPAIFIIAITIAGGLYKDQAVRDNILHQIQVLTGPARADTVQKIMENASGLGTSTMAKIVGIGTLIFSATTVFGSLENGLNNVWGIRPKPESNIWEFVRDRLLSLAMVVSLGFLLLVSLVADALILAFNNVLEGAISGATYYIISAANLAVSLLVITIIFALIFKIIPDAKIAWSDVWVGAFVTTLLFIIGKYCISFYVDNSSLSDAYGAAGSLVVLLLWVYYSSLILLFGAEFTYVYSRAAGHRIQPDEQAVRIKSEEYQDGVINE